MAAKIDLTALSIETVSQLNFVWNLIGVDEEERQGFLADLAEKVKAQYNGALSSQQERQSTLEKEIEALQARIAYLQEHMDQASDGLPPGEHLSLTAYRDLLESSRARVQGVWDGREGELKALLDELTAASARVAEAIPSGYEAIGDKRTVGRIAAYKQQVAAVAKLQGEREGRISALCGEISDLWADIEGTPVEQEDAYSYKAVTGGASAITAAYGWGTAVIATLEEKLAAIQADVDGREARITALGQQLTHYWGRLQTPEEEQRAFLEEHAGISDATFEVVEATIAAMKEQFHARLTELVGRARANIAACWDEMRAGPQQRREMFPAFFVAGGEGGGFTEELFAEHEGYLTHVRASLEDMKPIVRGLEKRDELLRDKAEYLTIIADASRLLAKGSSAARLKEEKLEKRVKKELPAVLKKLREQVKEWETATGRPFLVEDVRFIDTLDDEEAKEAQAKGEARAARHGQGSDAPATSAAPAAGTVAGIASAGAAAGTGRSTSNGRTAVARPVAASTSTGAGAAAPAPLSRKPSATAATLAPAAAAAATGNDENSGASAAPAAAPIVATKRAVVATVVAAPSVPLKEGSSNVKVASAAAAPGAPAIKVSVKPAVPLQVSAEAKASAAKMLGNL